MVDLINLGPNFGLRFFFPGGMPPIAATDFGALAILAERWVRRVDRVPTLELTNEQRRGSPAAAAAFAVKTFPNLPLEACRACGRWTGSLDFFRFVHRV